MKVSGGSGTRWMTDLINNIVKEGCIFQMIEKEYTGAGVQGER